VGATSNGDREGDMDVARASGKVEGEATARKEAGSVPLDAVCGVWAAARSGVERLLPLLSTGRGAAWGDWGDWRLMKTSMTLKSRRCCKEEWR
jgi:hypothetical protein